MSEVAGCRPPTEATSVPGAASAVISAGQVMTGGSLSSTDTAPSNRTTGTSSGGKEAPENACTVVGLSVKDMVAGILPFRIKLIVKRTDPSLRVEPFREPVQLKESSPRSVKPVPTCVLFRLSVEFRLDTDTKSTSAVSHAAENCRPAIWLKLRTEIFIEKAEPQEALALEATSARSVVPVPKSTCTTKEQVLVAPATSVTVYVTSVVP